MLNNDILRRLRFALDESDERVIALFRLAGAEVSRLDLTGYLAKEGEYEFLFLPDDGLRAFLDGLIISRRGPRPPGTPAPRPEGRLDNNLILRKLRIALELQDDAMLELLRLGGMEVSPSELAALFRRSDHKHYRPCGDQLLRALIAGLTARHRGLGR